MTKVLMNIIGYTMLFVGIYLATNEMHIEALRVWAVGMAAFVVAIGVSINDYVKSADK